MAKTGFFMDFSELNRNLERLTDVEFPEYIEKGEFNAMNELLNDSIIKPPQAPKDMGDLWGSRFVGKPKRTRKDISIIGGFKIKYAKKHHEAQPGTYNYTTTKGADQPGPKYMLSKMMQYGKKYIWIIAEAIRRKGK